jgi:spore maturation protein CgeB
MGLKISFFASSLVSAYWNGAATYYRGIVKALYERGHQTVFYEPDFFNRQDHRDIDDPEWAEVVVYNPHEADAVKMLERTSDSDIIIKASGVGILDDFLEAEVLKIRKPEQIIIFWDVDAPATLDRIKYNPYDPFKKLIPHYDLILTYGGGNPVVDSYKNAGARECFPVYNALDPSIHHPVNENADFHCDLAFLGNRLPDRETRVEEFFLKPAASLPDRKFILGGNGWGDKPKSSNVKYLDHVYTRDHNAFNSSPLAILNISRDSMARYGYSPATRIFEAAGAGACIITDYWEGIEYFFEQGKEILVAHNGDEVTDLLENLSEQLSAEIGKAALKKVLFEHTYTHRVTQLENILNNFISKAM